jgi:ATP-dependent DNA helicase RecG
LRPPILFPLFAPVSTLPGLGPKLGKLAERLTGPHVVDLLWHRPSGIVDRMAVESIEAAPDGCVVTLTVRVDGHAPPVQPNKPYRIRCTDPTGMMDLVYFHVKGDWLAKKLPVGTRINVCGRAERYNGQLQIAHPDYAGPPEEAPPADQVEPTYPLTGGLNPKPLRTALKAALERTPDLPEWQDAAWLKRRDWLPWKAALTRMHNPLTAADVEAMGPVRQRLAFDELLANQLALCLVRWHQRRLAGRAVQGDGRLRAQVLTALPWSLTGAQTRSLTEITADMATGQRMLRLLQGDVGSGKTIVALLAMLNAVEAGFQAALMAPTEILARQHVDTLAPLCAAAGVRLAVLTGRDKGRTRQAVLDRLAAGEIDILVGTHAIFQDDVTYRDLALIIIDEQHKFGVDQRLQLAAKGRGVDTLVMTATPIPRTLTLTAYGDMDISRLDEKPPGRSPVKTATIALDRLEEVMESLPRAIRDGQRIYWVCPLVEESELVDLANATLRHATLRERLGERVGLVHGKMKGPEKDAVMARFAAGELDVLVATTVIEVGVNVPEATIMVVEHAERFGLAQLHQLRGRVGRGAAESRCLLLYAGPLGEVARERLSMMKATEDGFLIAEKDLQLRGAGEVLGTKQSGLPDFRLADLAVHGELLAAARDDARLILDRDPELESPRGEALRILLYLFERDAAVKYLRSG